MSLPDIIKIRVITLSDRASKGEYEDLSGPEITRLCTEFFEEKQVNIEIRNLLIPDDPVQLSMLVQDNEEKSIHVLFTTGGTGIGPKDFTPDVISELLDKEIPGVMEMIRVKYGMQKPNALISRSIAGVKGQMLIYALPGSVKAVREYCSEILPTVLHSMKMIYGLDDHS
ncbi:MAG: MogA/MoaB family molybdenum cofactor biosynthesis protein [Bacteroidales bacterium]|nr:MogA/MoaB family molybdenum cofactor biosynthesis protein [Bacteroidales bacterium]